MTKMIFVSLPVTDLQAAIAFYRALGFERNPQFSDDNGACMVWSEAVDAMNQAAATHGGQADVNPVQDLGFMCSRDLADPSRHLWGAFWMDPAAIPPSNHQA